MTTSPSAVPSNSLQAIGCMVIATLCMACMNAIVRHLSLSLHTFEIVFFRNFFGILLILPLLVRSGLLHFRTERFGLHAIRAVINVVNMIIYMSALAMAPLADVVSIGFAAPLFATLLAVIFFGDRPGIRRWTVLAIGLVGMLLILKPGSGEMNTGHLLALVASMTWACILLIVHSLGRTESSVTTIAYMTVLMTPMSLVPALFVWQMPTPIEWAWLVATGVLGAAGQLLLAQALRVGDISVVMPFDFFRLLWVALIAYLAFAEVPDALSWLGGTVIFASSVYLVLRERKIRRSKPAEPPV